MIILGSGPNRIGQGIEFDYSCVHASMALSEAGYETVMVNCNPETVSTDYDTSDRLYFEPLTLEDVLEIVHAERQAGPIAGVICQLGGQTPLGLAQGLEDAGVPIVGTPPAAIHLAEERGAFGRVLAEAGLPAPKHGLASSFTEARDIAAEIGYPVLVRPSYVLGGRGMEIVYDDEALEGYITRATEVSPEHPVLVDRFIDDAVEIDVDALFDGEELYLGGVMEHIEEAGIHSGDSSCALPPITLGAAEIKRIRAATEAIARGVGVRGLINIQFALGSDVLYVLEANPRASRTVPFVSKATAVPLAKAAARVMLGEPIKSLRAAGLLNADGDGGDLPPDAPIAVKEAVMPFNRFKTPDGRTVDTVLGPEMRSTGEVMGFDAVFGTAFAKSQTASYGSLPTGGRVFVSMANRDKRTMIFPIKRLADLGFEVLATQGTAEVLRRNGISATVVRKHFEGPGPAGEPTTIQLIAAGGGPARRQHPARLRVGRLAPRRRLRDPHRGGDGQHPVHHDRAGARRRGAGHRGGHRGRHRGAVAAGLGCPLMYDAFFDRVLTRTDAERAHHAAFRAIRAARPVTGAALRTAGLPVSAMGLTFPHALGPGRRLRQERRRHRRAGRPRLRARRDRHRDRRAAARQPHPAALPAAGRPRRGQPDGLQQRRRRRRRRPARGPSGAPGDRDVVSSSASTSARPRWCRRTTRRPSRPTTRRAPACWRRTPTTSSSTSPRPTRRGCAACRRSTGSARCWSPYAGGRTTSTTDAGAAAGQDRPRPRRRRRARGRRAGSGASASTGSSPPTRRSAGADWSPTPARSSGSARAGSPAARSRRARSRCCACCARRSATT